MLHHTVFSPSVDYTYAAPPVVLLHGLASSADASWQRTGWIRALTQAGRSVVTIDLPGHGGSPPPDNVDGYRPSRMIKAVTDTLSALQYGPFESGSGLDVVSYSLGSRLAWDWAANAPNAIRRLVLGAPSTQDPFASLDPAVLEAASGGEAIYVEDDCVQAVLDVVRALKPDNSKELYQLIDGLSREPFDPSFAAPTMPLLLVAGERDRLVKSMSSLVDYAPQAEMLWLANRNHQNAITSRAFKNRVIDFLGTTN